MRRLFATALAIAVLTLGSGARLLAQQGHEHKVMGTVTMASADQVMLKDGDGKDVMIKITKDTEVKAKPAVEFEDIKVGSRIVVTAVEEKDKSMTAKSIEVGPVAAATKSRSPENRNYRMRKTLLFATLAVRVPSLAMAHVSVRPRESKPGAEEQYTMRVPTEGAVATTHVMLEIPRDVTVLELLPADGATFETEKEGDRITSIAWRKAIPPKAAAEFAFRARNPGATEIAWKAHQHFSVSCVRSICPIDKKSTWRLSQHRRPFGRRLASLDRGADSADRRGNRANQNADGPRQPGAACHHGSFADRKIAVLRCDE